MRFVDLVGMRFGSLTVVAQAPGRTPHGYTVWLCDCDCGKRGHIVSSNNLKEQKSCGCRRIRWTSRRKETLTQTRIKELLSYDPDTGEFTWLVDMRGRAKAGDRAGCMRNTGYWGITVDGKGCEAHRLAWLYVYGYFPKRLDHKNRNKTDNRIANLRESDRSQNAVNTELSQKNSSGFKGVSWIEKRQKYQARIAFRKKDVHLRYCDTAEEAAWAYDYCAKRLFGEFALTNKMMGLLDHYQTPPRGAAPASQNTGVTS